ncbi:MAG: hypothetical protein QMC89_06130 [Candidatus Hodarchaeaceae archaeon]|nr:hypothetical protein [Candidatus Hodarchaeaceae archaeon]
MADAENLPFYLLFSVVMAVLLCGVFVMQVSKQREAGVDEQAQLLVDDIARACFAALVRQQPTYVLPTDVGGSDYELRVDNRTIVLTIIRGMRKGQSYYSGVNVELEVRSLPGPGEKLFVQGRSDRVIISAEPIETALPEIELPKEDTAPEFLWLGKGE